jgi:protein SCO1/2
VTVRRALWSTLLLAGLTIAGTAACGDGEEPLRTLFHVPAFELTADDGTAFGSQSLRGRVWIASFLFSSCTSVCPTLASQLATLEERTAPYGDRVHIVSITVDPEVDTPERLHEYAARFRHDPARWTFLTGHPDTVNATIRRGFLMPEPERRDIEQAPGYDVMHGANVMLFDETGGCRGLYRTDGPGMEQLLHDIDRLLP